jgi:hypothetical protein
MELAYNRAKTQAENSSGEMVRLGKILDVAEIVAGLLVGPETTEEELPIVSPQPEPEPVPEPEEAAPLSFESQVRQDYPEIFEPEEKRDVDDAMDKMAAGMLGRWLKRQRTRLMGGRTKGLRMEADRLIRQTAQALDRLMDSLEKSNVPGNELIDGLQGVSRQLAMMLDAIKEVALENNRRYKEERAGGDKGAVRVDERDFRLLVQATRDAAGFAEKVDKYRQRTEELAQAERKLRA